MKARPLPPIDPASALRFDGFVDDRGGPDACWPWRGGLVGGYGSFRLGRRKVYAHRVAWVLAGNPEPETPLDHLCHDPRTCDGEPCYHRRCCNPRHLAPATYVENNSTDRRRTRAYNVECPSGHPFTPENTEWFTHPRTGATSRLCRACRLEQARVAHGVVVEYGHVDPNRCRNGHDRKHSYRGRTGKTVCRRCRNAAERRNRCKR